jgi:hypothetical protein
MTGRDGRNVFGLWSIAIYLCRGEIKTDQAMKIAQDRGEAGQ